MRIRKASRRAKGVQDRKVGSEQANSPPHTSPSSFGPLNLTWVPGSGRTMQLVMFRVVSTLRTGQSEEVKPGWPGWRRRRRQRIGQGPWCRWGSRTPWSKQHWWRAWRSRTKPGTEPSWWNPRDSSCPESTPESASTLGSSSLPRREEGRERGGEGVGRCRRWTWRDMRLLDTRPELDPASLSLSLVSQSLCPSASASATVCLSIHTRFLSLSRSLARSLSHARSSSSLCL